MTTGNTMKWSEVTQLCPTLCDPTDCSLQGSSVHEIFQARIPEWGAVAFSRGSSQPKDRTRVSRIVGRRLTVWAIREAGNTIVKVKVKSLSHIWLFATPWTVAHQAPPSMGFSRQEYCSGFPLPSLGDRIFLTQGSNSGLLHYRQTLYRLSHQGRRVIHSFGYMDLCW